MNGNLSTQQVRSLSATNGDGVMPLNPKFDGPAPIKAQSHNGVKQPNQNILLPKPGFF